MRLYITNSKTHLVLRTTIVMIYLDLQFLSITTRQAQTICFVWQYFITQQRTLTETLKWLTQKAWHGSLGKHVHILGPLCLTDNAYWRCNGWSFDIQMDLFTFTRGTWLYPHQKKRFLIRNLGMPRWGLHNSNLPTLDSRRQGEEPANSDESILEKVVSPTSNSGDWRV